MTEPQFDHLLAVDTSTRQLRLAVSFGGDRLVTFEERVDRSHGQVLFRKISDLLLSANLSVTMLQGIVVCIGPGSFTGLRIGLAAVKGVATVLDIPVAAISLFDLAGYRLRDVSDDVRVLVPHKRGQYFCGVVRNGQCATEQVSIVTLEQVMSSPSDQPFAGIGFDPHERPPDPAFLARVEQLTFSGADLIHIGRAALSSGRRADLAHLEPLYLQKSQAEIRFDERRQEQ